jgi:hypothetical protein
MLTLRTAHLTFIWIAILGADLFGLWAVWNYVQARQPGLLALGIVSLVGGLGLLLYAVRFVKKFDEAGIR